MRLFVRILPVGMDVCSDCCGLSGRGLCDGLITRPEESYRLWCVVVCDLETSWMRRLWPTGGLIRQKQRNVTLRKAYPNTSDVPVTSIQPKLDTSFFIYRRYYMTLATVGVFHHYSSTTAAQRSYIGRRFD